VTDDPDWVAAGLDELTGPADGPPVVPRRRLGAGLRHLGELVGSGVDGPALAAERAHLSGFRRRGRVSCGGGARLVGAADGRDVCVNLPRRDDVELVEAWLGVAPGGDPWAAVERGLATADADDAVERGQLLGLPVAVAVTPEEADADEQAVARRDVERVAAAGESRVAPGDRARVVDLSALWAGPLCGRLLARAGHDVVKVETTSRPDGARYGPPAFFDALNRMKTHRAADVDELPAVVADADVVIVSARPRALRQLDLDPFDAVARRPWQVWVAVTGYGLTGPWSDRVAFGDDAAVAAGLSALADGWFCADAFADPCAGLAAAAGALSLLRRGRGGVVDISLREAAACVRS
jgi:crotonobetainyl-CoA:carnitine CoA-transferase CaiB-like acyl-CoA transferase